MSIRVRDRIERQGVGSGPLFAALRDRTGSTAASLRALLGRLEAHPGIEMTLVELFCARTEDLTGDDSLRAEVYADGRQVLVSRTDLNEGETWPLNETVTFRSQLVVLLFEEDFPDEDDTLGRVTITATSRPDGRYTTEFDRDDALYQFRYVIANPRSDARSTVRTAQGFDPTRHAFAFTNSFPFVEDPIDLGIPDVDPIEISESYGLCGGMSQAVKDFYLAQRSIPTDQDPPRRDRQLYDYLFVRQLDTFGEGLEYVSKFIDWHGESQGRLEARTLGEWADVKRRLDFGELVLLGLLYTDAEVLWDNHQVLAYGYTEDATAGTVTVQIYDPNAPAQESQLELQIGDNAVQGTENIEGKTKSLNGFFVMNVPTERPSTGL